MSELRIIIAGSRGFNDYDLLKREVLRVLQSDSTPKEYITIISGDAKGADRLGEKFGKEFGIKVKKMSAKWNNFGQYDRGAGYKRNIEMADFAVADNNYGILIAFWDGFSKGTKHMINTAHKKALEVHVINY